MIFVNNNNLTLKKLKKTKKMLKIAFSKLLYYNTKDKNDCTILHLAIFSKNLDLVKWLFNIFDLSQFIDCQNKHGETALYTVIEMVEFFISSYKY